jgi:hypothetical protein
MSALAEALAAAQAELPLAVGRDSQGNGYRYTSLDKLIAETRPILSKHGIAITQEPSFIQVGETLRPILITKMGYGGDVSKFSTPLYVPDSTMQGLGTAITYARRYAWAAALGIASEEDTDGAALVDQEDVPF